MRCRALCYQLEKTCAWLTIRARGLEYGFLRSWGSVSFIVVVTAAGFWLESGSSNHVAYMLLGGMGLIFIAVCFLPDLRSPPRENAGRKFASAPAWALLRDRRFQLLLLAAAANMSAHAALNGYSTIYWKAAGISESQISMLWSVGVVAEILLFWGQRPCCAQVRAWRFNGARCGGVV